jgi:hypothetical protein
MDTASAHIQFIPEFVDGANASYMALSPLPAEAEHALHIQLWLRAYMPTGLLFYAAHPDAAANKANGDFVAVLLVRRMVHFVYQLGSGLASIR